MTNDTESDTVDELRDRIDDLEYRVNELESRFERSGSASEDDSPPEAEIVVEYGDHWDERVIRHFIDEQRNQVTREEIIDAYRMAGITARDTVKTRVQSITKLGPFENVSGDVYEFLGGPSNG